MILKKIQKQNIFHGYRVDCFVENRCVGRLNILGVPFGGMKRIETKIMEIYNTKLKIT